MAELDNDHVENGEADPEIETNFVQQFRISFTKMRDACEDHVEQESKTGVQVNVQSCLVSRCWDETSDWVSECNHRQ